MELSFTSSSRHQQLQQPSSHPLRMGLASSLRRKASPEGLTSSLFLPHLLGDLLFLALHLGAGHVVGFLLYPEDALSKVFVEELEVSPSQAKTYLIGELLLSSFASLVSLIASGHLEGC
jgi:hypothetical protein